MGSCACASQRRRRSPHAPRWQYTSELLALVGYGVPLTATQSGLLRMGRGIAFRYVRARCTRYASLTLPSPHPTPPPSPPAPLDPHPYLHPHPPSSPPSPSGGGGGPRSGVVGGESARNERCYLQCSLAGEQRCGCSRAKGAACAVGAIARGGGQWEAARALRRAGGRARVLRDGSIPPNGWRCGMGCRQRRNEAACLRWEGELRSAVYGRGGGAGPLCGIVGSESAHDERRWLQ